MSFKKSKNKEESEDFLKEESLNPTIVEVETKSTVEEKDLLEKVDDDIKDIKDKKRSNLLEVITETVTSNITKGELDRQETPFEISHNKIMSERHIKQVFQITKLPDAGVYSGYAEGLRYALKNKFYTKEEKSSVDLIINQTSRHCPQNMGSRKIKSNEKIVKKQINVLLKKKKEMKNPQEGLSQVSPILAEEVKNDPRLKSSVEMMSASREDLHQINEQILTQKKKMISFNEVDKHQRNGGTCLELYFFIEIISKTVELSNKASEYMREILSERGYENNEIKDLANYEKYFGVGSLKNVKLPKGMMATFKPTEFDVLPFFTTSNIPASSLGFRPGICRKNAPELYIGNNIENNYREDINLTSGDSNNFMVLGQVSCGKTAQLALSISTALDSDKFNVIIRDYKGKEWSKFSDLVGNKGEVISTDSDTGSFVNSYIIVDYTKYGFKDFRTAYTLSQSFTVKSLTCLIGNVVKREIATNICKDIVKKVFLNANVQFDQVSTYNNSSKINFVSDTWVAISDIMSDIEIKTKYGDKEFNLVKSALAQYFSPLGERRNMFTKEIGIDDLLFSKRLLVFDTNAMGIAGSMTTLPNETSFNLMQQTYITRLYTAMSKMNGKHTIVVVEQIEEYFNNEDVLTEIIAMCKLGNSLNVINYMVLNTIDKFLSQKTGLLADLRENITGYIIGKCELGTVEQLIQIVPGLLNTKEMLTNISNGKGKYKYSFLYYHKLGLYNTVVTRMPVNDEIISKIVNIKEKEKIEDDDFKY